MTALPSIARAAAPWVLAAVVGAVVWSFTPWVGPAAAIGRAERDRDTARDAAREWERHARGWMASFVAAENARDAEAATAREAADWLADRCDLRVAEARRSARAIETLINREPTHEPNPDPAGRCPVRQLADPGELRRALQPAD